jgi:hypothetical protein
VCGVLEDFEVERVFGFKAFCRAGCRTFLPVALLGLSFHALLAENCSVVKHGPASDAEKAFLAADYGKAEGLYRASLDKQTGDETATVGLVHSLLRQQKVQQAADVVKTAVAAAPKSGAFLTLRGEVEFRQGQLWLVEPTVISAYKLDSCNPRTRLLFARISQVNSKYATARQQITLAHQLDPEDPEIRAAWIPTLPLDQRITETESYLSAPTGDDQDTLRMMHSDLDRWKKQSGQPERACRISSTASSAEIPFIKLAGWGGHPRAYGFEMNVNGTTARLELGAGEGGVTVYRSVAERAGLKKLTDPEKSVIPGGKPTYLAYADSLKLGKLEFQNCTLKVIDGSSPFDDGEGTIGVDAFADFLVTLDYPMRKMQLGPLPARPQETAAAVATLKTDSSVDRMADGANLHDRFMAPEMKDYSQIYRFGNSLVLPAALNGTDVRLFLLNLGARETNVTPDVAKKISKVHEQEMGFGPGPAQKVLVADEITFNFAHLSQKVNGVVSVDTSWLSRIAGTEITGFIGANTLNVLVMHIDFRDGLVKFDYIPNSEYKSD